MIKSVEQQLALVMVLFVLFWLVAFLGLTQVSKGARLHQLNSLHLKYSAELEKLVEDSKDAVPDLDRLQRTVANIRRQPEQCLLTFNAFDRLVAKMIGTSIAIEVCRDDILVANQLLAAIQSYRDGQIGDRRMHGVLDDGAPHFMSHSAEFLQPITRTVDFMLTSTLWVLGAVGFTLLTLVFALSRRVARSVIEVERADEALRESESRMALVLDSVPVGICYFDTAERYRFASAHYHFFHSSSPQDVQGKTICEVVGKPLYKKIQPNIKRALSGEAFAFETCHVDHAGRQVDIGASYTPHRNHRGQVDGVFVVVQDIAERKRAEAILRASERRLRSAFSNIQAGCIVIDEQGVIEIFNPAAEKIFGHAAASMVGQNIKCLMPPPFRDAHDNYLENYLNGGKPRVIGAGREVVGLRKDGEQFPMHLGVGEMIVNHRRSFIGSILDLTAVKNLEAQLHQSQRMEAIGQLTGGVAHDFNNLLAVMMGNLELVLSESPGGENSRRHMHSVMDAVQRAADLTSQLLAFSRKQTLNATHVSAQGLLQDSLTLLRRTLGEDIAISVDHNADDVVLCIDVGMFGNALLNLALNARDAMPDGGDLAIETSAVELDGKVFADQAPSVFGRYVRVSVSDTGRGIAEEDLAHILEPFFTTKQVGKGSGLGLSMVYGFVMQSGGHLSVNSQPGKGTEVHMFFPVVEAGIVATSSAPPALPSAGSSEQTILLVEDDAALRATGLVLLEHLGYTVLQAADGPSAMAVLAQHANHIDLLLSDVVMPGGMSGFDLAGKVQDDYPGIPILLTSGYPESAGQSDFALLKKPYGLQQLSQTLRDIFDGQADISR